MTEDKRTMNRRTFLQGSTAAGLAGYSAIQSASAAVSSWSPEDKRYRIGVLGSTGRGDYGHDMDTAWLDFPNCEIVGVSDHDEDGLAEAAKRLDVKETFSDYRQMLDKAKPDIACICPDRMADHYKMAMAAAERGIHIYIEKPFVPSLKQADDIAAACEASGAKFALALWSRHSPKWLRVKQLIADGAIGRVLEYRARGKEDDRGGAEDLYVLGIHLLDMIRFFAGHPVWCFAHMSQNGEPVSKRHLEERDGSFGPIAGNVVHAMWGMPGSSAAYFGSRQNARGNPSRYALQICGTGGIIELREGCMPPVKYLADPSWSPGRSGAQWQDVSSAGIGIPEPLSGREYEARYALGILDLLDAIENDREPVCNIQESRAVVEMTMAVFESHRLKRPVTLPLETRVHPFTLPFTPVP